MSNYILIEEVMNGTVTMTRNVMIVNASSFGEAINKIKLLPNFDKMYIIEENNSRFCYKTKEPVTFPVYGSIENIIAKAI
jgi:hypothetical protein